MTHHIRILAVAAMLAGCAPVERDARPAPQTPPEDAPATSASKDGADPQATPPRATGDLGATVASLGTAKEPGTWLKTPLVAVPGPGRLTDPETGRATRVDLIPLDAERGAGSRLALAGFRALGLPPTRLPELRVTALPD